MASDLPGNHSEHMQSVCVAWFHRENLPADPLRFRKSAGLVVLEPEFKSLLDGHGRNRAYSVMRIATLRNDCRQWTLIDPGLAACRSFRATDFEIAGCRRMPARCVSIDHDPPLLLPPDLRDWVPEDHLVHFLMEAVGLLDVSAARINQRGSGRPRAKSRADATPSRRVKARGPRNSTTSPTPRAA